MFSSEPSLIQPSTSSSSPFLLSASISRIHSRVWSLSSSFLFRQLVLSLRKACRQQREEDLPKKKVKSESIYTPLARLIIWPFSMINQGLSPSLVMKTAPVELMKRKETDRESPGFHYRKVLFGIIWHGMVFHTKGSFVLLYTFNTENE